MDGDYHEVDGAYHPSCVVNHVTDGAYHPVDGAYHDILEKKFNCDESDNYGGLEKSVFYK